MTSNSKQQQTVEREREIAGVRALSAAIGDRVLHSLGRPADLHRVETRRLWGDHFRVNVFVGAQVGSLTIAHSFFLVADGEGQILTSTPAITKRY